MFKVSPFLMIAWNSFWEARHNKVLYIAAGFVAGLIIFSLFLGEVSLYQNEKVVKDVGMAAISLLGVFVAIFLGVNGLYRDLERRTIYTLISKPIDRYQIVLGKLLGMIFVLGLVVAIMTIFLYGVIVYVEKGVVDLTLLPAIGLIYVELIVVASIAVFFSSFSTPFLSGFFSIGLFIVGRSAFELGQFGERSKNEIFKLFATGIQKVFDFHGFNLRTEAIHKLPIYAEDIVYPIVYAVALCIILFMFSVLAFGRRDFK